MSVARSTSKPGVSAPFSNDLAVPLLLGHGNLVAAGAVAPAWREHAGYADARGAGVAERMLELPTPGPGDRVLELACGAGGLGLAVASRVAPGGEVVLSYVVAEMTAIASARADALGLTNVSIREPDLESIEQPDESYDVVLCREGLMFATDPDRAAREIRRVLRPGGRVEVAVWGPRERTPGWASSSTR
jgi:enediyne biosynthesis protein CalE5